MSRDAELCVAAFGAEGQVVVPATTASDVRQLAFQALQIITAASLCTPADRQTYFYRLFKTLCEVLVVIKPYTVPSLDCDCRGTCSDKNTQSGHKGVNQWA